MSVMDISTLLLISLSFGVICNGLSVKYTESTMYFGSNYDKYYGWRIVSEHSPVPKDAFLIEENATKDLKTYVGRTTLHRDSLPFYELPPIKIKVNTTTGERSSFTDYNKPYDLFEILVGGNLQWVLFAGTLKNVSYIAVPLWERTSDESDDKFNNNKNTFICKINHEINGALYGKFNENSNGSCITDVLNPLSNETSSSTFELLVVSLEDTTA